MDFRILQSPTIAGSSEIVIGSVNKYVILLNFQQSYIKNGQRGQIQDKN